MTPQQPWLPDHPVLEALRNRRRHHHTPQHRTDAYKIGLAVEGGGIRGVVSAAMLTALEDLGMVGAVDAIYAASSGAVNSAYFLTGDSWYPLSIYYDDLTTRQFLDIRRIPRGTMLDLTYAFDVVIDQAKPLNYQQVIAAPAALHVAVTDVDDIRTVVASDFTCPADLREALIASAWLPIAVRGWTTWRGRRAIDGLTNCWRVGHL
jgi:predicted patatin/cPLA2 family phospholipase